MVQLTIVFCGVANTIAIYATKYHGKLYHGIYYHVVNCHGINYHGTLPPQNTMVALIWYYHGIFSVGSTRL